jgi:hypothetical protein
MIASLCLCVCVCVNRLFFIFYTQCRLKCLADIFLSPTLLMLERFQPKSFFFTLIIWREMGLSVVVVVNTVTGSYRRVAWRLTSKAWLRPLSHRRRRLGNVLHTSPQWSMPKDGRQDWRDSQAKKRRARERDEERPRLYRLMVAQPRLVKPRSGCRDCCDCHCCDSGQGNCTGRHCSGTTTKTLVVVLCYLSISLSSSATSGGGGGAGMYVISVDFECNKTLTSS